MILYAIELLMWLTIAVSLGLALRPYLYGKGRADGRPKHPQ